MDYKVLLTELLSTLRLSKKKFAEQLKLSQGNVSDWFNRPGYRPSIDALKRISDTYNVNLNWLVTGEGEMFNDTLARGSDHLPGSIKMISIPVVAPIAAGPAIQVVEDEPLEVIQVGASLLKLPPPYYAFKVEGESMAPFIQEGDIVVLSRDWRGVDINDKICGFRTADGITLKRYLIQPKKKTAWLMPMNHGYQPIEYGRDTEDLSLIGVMVLVVRRTL